MDPLTHSALGAVVAGLITGNRDDLRAPALGALAGALPDIDIIPTLFLGPLSQLDLHRGITTESRATRECAMSITPEFQPPSPETKRTTFRGSRTCR